MLVGVVCVIVVTAITVMVRLGRERRINENRAMRDYVRRISPDRDADN